MGCIQCRVGSIGQSSTTSVDTNSDAAKQVAHSDGDARPKERKARVITVRRVDVFALNRIQLRREHNRHDNTVDSNDFAEDDGDQILGSDSRCLDAAAEDGRAGNEDAPVELSRVRDE